MSDIDVSYFTKKIKMVLRDIKLYSKEELARELLRLSKTADSEVLHENEFSDWVMDAYLIDSSKPLIDDKTGE